MNRRSVFKLRLYIAGDAPNSTEAIANLGSICRQHLSGRHQVEVVDVFREPQRALADGIFMTPTLLRLAPGPIRRIVGTLSHARPVLQVLELEAPDA